MKRNYREIQVNPKKDEKKIISGVGERCRERRESIGLSRGVVAQSINVSLSTLQAWENQEREPSASDILRLAETLKVSASWLLVGDELSPATGTTEQEEQHIESESRMESVLGMLSDSQQTQLAEVIIQVGITGIIKLGRTNELADKLLSLPAEEQERLLALHEAKKGASTAGDENELISPTHKQAG